MKIKRFYIITVLIIHAILTSPVAVADPENETATTSQSVNSDIRKPIDKSMQSANFASTDNPTNKNLNNDSKSEHVNKKNNISIFDKIIITILLLLITLGFFGFVVVYKRISAFEKSMSILKRESKIMINSPRSNVSSNNMDDGDFLIKKRLEDLEKKYLDRADLLESKVDELSRKVESLILQKLSQDQTDNMDRFPVKHNNSLNASDPQKKVSTAIVIEEKKVLQILSTIQSYLESQQSSNITGKQAQEAIKKIFGSRVVDVLPLSSSLDELIMGKNYEAIRIDFSESVHLSTGANSLLVVRKDTLQDTKLSLLFDGLPLGAYVQEIQRPVHLKLDNVDIGKPCNITESMAVLKGQVISIGH